MIPREEEVTRGEERESESEGRREVLVGRERRESREKVEGRKDMLKE